jgi:TonB family protein
MKSRINIMHGREDITDEELERFKNFDALLSKHYRIINEKKPFSWRFIIPALVLTGSLVIYLWTSIKPESGKSEVTQDTLVEHVQAPLATDSIVPVQEQQNTPTPQADEKKLKPDASVQYLSRPAVINDETTKSADSVAQLTPATETPPQQTVKFEPVYVPAEPVDGYEALYAYFSNELIYPKEAVKDSVEGVLIVKFLINKEGKPEKVETSGSLGVLFDKEALRLIEHMPLWKPATINGKPITSKLSIPLTFRITTRK